MLWIRDILVGIRILGSVPLSNGSGCGFRRPKNIRTLWIRIDADPDPQHCFLWTTGHYTAKACLCPIFWLSADQWAVHTDSPGIILLLLGVVLAVGNQLISHVFIYGRTWHYPVPAWLLAISWLVSCVGVVLSAGNQLISELMAGGVCLPLSCSSLAAGNQLISQLLIYGLISVILLQLGCWQSGD